MSRVYPCVYCTEDGYCKKYSDDEVTSQNLDTIKTNHCCYVMNQTLVEIILHEDRPVGECRHLGGCE